MYKNTCGFRELIGLCHVLKTFSDLALTYLYILNTQKKN